MVVLPRSTCFHTTLGMQVAVILMLSTSVNCALKLAFHGTRPYWISSMVKGLATETSFACSYLIMPRALP